MTGLFARWQRGWGVARDLPLADDVGGVLRVRSMQHGRDVEYFAADADDAERLSGLVLREDSVTWLTVPAADPSRTAAALEAAGLILLKRADQLMTIDLQAQPLTTPPEPYRLHTRVSPGADGVAITTVVRHESGEVAARGTMGLIGADAVADRIETMRAHRRRGLGGAVMSELARSAMDRGASTGILVASQEGQPLYATLGWQPVSVILIATTPGNSYPA